MRFLPATASDRRLSLFTLYSEEQIAAHADRSAGGRNRCEHPPLKPDFACRQCWSGPSSSRPIFCARRRAAAALSLPLECLWLRSYGQNRVGADDITVLSGPTEAVRGKTVLLMDGVLDKGTTLVKARALLLAQAVPPPL